MLARPKTTTMLVFSKGGFGWPDKPTTERSPTSATTDAALRMLLSGPVRFTSVSVLVDSRNSLACPAGIDCRVHGPRVRQSDGLVGCLEAHEGTRRLQQDGLLHNACLDAVVLGGWLLSPTSEEHPLRRALAASCRRRSQPCRHNA